MVVGQFHVFRAEFYRVALGPVDLVLDVTAAVVFPAAVDVAAPQKQGRHGEECLNWVFRHCLRKAPA